MDNERNGKKRGIAGWGGKKGGREKGKSARKKERACAMNMSCQDVVFELLNQH